jgi:hypothetical protein
VRAELSAQRDAYFPFAQRCAQLYFAIAPLWAFNHCYNFGVQAFQALFRKCFLAALSTSTSTTGGKEAGSNSERLDKVIFSSSWFWILLSFSRFLFVIAGIL